MGKHRPFMLIGSFSLLAGLVFVASIPLVLRGQVDPQASEANGSFSFTTIDFPGSPETIPFKLNARGEIVGGYIDSLNAEHGFLLQGGSFSTFDVPGGVGSTQPEGINDRSEITGAYDDSSQVTHGFLRQRDGSVVTIDPPASAGYTEANGINNSGTIVGRYFGNSPGFQGYLFGNGDYSTLDVPDATDTSLFGINNRDDIVGAFKDASGVTHGFLLSHGRFTTIDFPGATNTNCQDINDRGEIVGSTVVDGVRHGYLFSKGNFRRITAPGASLAVSGLPLSGTDAHGINSRGEIVGSYKDTSGVIHGFVAR